MITDGKGVAVAPDRAGADDARHIIAGGDLLANNPAAVGEDAAIDDA